MKFFSPSLFVSFFISVAALNTHAEDAIAMRILVLGNSISQHLPDPKIGWFGSWGMAASKEGSDYVHLFASMIEKKGIRPVLDIKNVSQIEKGRNASLDFLVPASTDELVIIQLGDNFENSDAGMLNFQASYQSLLMRVKNYQADAKIFCLGGWGKLAVENFIRESCEKSGATYVKLDDIKGMNGSRADSSMAFKIEAVGEHPSDLGMLRIAQRLNVQFAKSFPFYMDRR